MMSKKTPVGSKRVAIALEMDWGYKRHQEVYAGCQRFADEAGWDTSIHPAPERELKRRSKERPYDGIIARTGTALAAAARDASIPVVNVWKNSPVEGLPSVYPDYEAAGAMAAEHLLSRGFRQFGYLGFERDIDSQLQLAGFREVIRREGFRCSTFRYPRTSIAGKAIGWERFVRGVEDWMDTWKPPIGIFAVGDLDCRYLIDVCRSKGLHVSQQVALVGRGNETAICDAPAPTLTSVDMGYAQVGYQAAAMLDRLMSGQRPPDQPELVLPSELIPRQSTDAYAADDPLVARALRFIAENSHQSIQVKHVASEVATTRRTLERKFQESVGRTIAGEIARLRIERAKRRLIETDDSMKVVGVDSGFRTADHFYKVFLRIEGMTPSAYRESRQPVFIGRSG
ncbi:MAG: LacI family transcriptional regulator [Kiritimatiellia bacterium]|jgi:LacI family transcriptional regulator